MTNTSWKNEVKKNYEEITKYNYIGLRGTCQDENYKAGDYARNSLDWDFENDCSSENELGGTSTIEINNAWIESSEDLIERIERALPGIDQYHGHQTILVSGDYTSAGSDENEIVIANAKVLAIIK